MTSRLGLGLLTFGVIFTAGIIFLPPLRQQVPAISRKESLQTKALNQQIADLNRHAKLAEQQGNYTEAESCLRQRMRLKPKDTLAHLDLAKLYDKMGRSSDAVANYRLVMGTPAVHISDPTLMTHFGEVCLAAGDSATARRSFEGAAATSASYYGPILKPVIEETTDMSILRGIAYASKACAGGYLEECLADLRKAYFLAPNSPYVCYAYADLLHGLQQYADARKLFDRAIRLTTASDRPAVEAMVNANANISPYSEITTYDARGRVISHVRVAIKLENMPLVFPPHPRPRMTQPETRP